MLNHLSLGCTDLKAATTFYDAVLAPLGYVRVCSGNSFAGYGVPGDTDDQFAIKQNQSMVPPGPGFHLAFGAPSRASVDEFYRKAVQLGGKDNGAPGLRPHYGPTYYAAFVFDLDGHAIEAVCHREE
jgi:catechol 2,3-dioxygenase-like lactoylglutathione lyase family enzyme